jgi:hypothetical protein
MTTTKTLLAAASTALALLGCTSMGNVQLGNESAVTEATAKQLAGDVPLPAGSVIRQQDSLVMGSGNTWMGRLNVSVSGEPQTVFAWFRDSLPGAGWTLTSSSYSKLSLLTFTKADRVATVQLQAGNFGTNEVLITVTPAVRPASPAGTGRP